VVKPGWSAVPVANYSATPLHRSWQKLHRRMVAKAIAPGLVTARTAVNSSHCVVTFAPSDGIICVHALMEVDLCKHIVSKRQWRKTGRSP
jgi:hypothetical protein